MMRGFVLILAVLAGVKVWTQERLYRQGAEEALLLAYRDRAIAACQSQQPTRVASVGTSPLWTRPASVALEIGRSSVDVSLWQLDDALWPARYKHPHVVLTAQAGAPRSVCEYDVIEGRAYLGRL
jgi:hypothetical protein